jgi:hypothetical protein
MPLMILYGGELVFAFLGLRVARWMWRSRDHVLALWRARNGGAASGPSYEPDPIAAPIPLARRAPRMPVRRAA